MRRSVPCLLSTSGLLVVLFLLSSCGGGGSKSATAATVTITPNIVSLNAGGVVQLGAVATDSSNTVVGGDVTYSSDNTNLVSVSSTGLVCGGTWDSKIVVCTPPKVPLGSATVSATIKGATGTVKVYVHEKIDRVVATGPGTTCASMGETQQFTATAYSNDPAVCTRIGTTAPCALPAATVGQPSWVITDTKVATIDNSVDKSGLVTAVIPGRTGVYADVSNVNSPILTFDTCAVKSIQLAVQNSAATSFTLDKAATQTLVATVVDSKGTTLTGPPISWLTSQPFVSTVVGQTTVTNGLVTATNSGTTTFVASCSPPNCNRNLWPVYSNPIVGNVNGTAGGTVYAGSTDSTQVVPIDVATNTGSSAVTLPRAPDSMMVNPQGTRIALGSSGGVMVLDATSNAVTSASRGGTVLAITPDGGRVAVIDTPNKTFYGYVFSSGNFDAGYSITPALTHVDAPIDSSLFFGVNGTNAYYSLFTGSFGTANLTAPANDVSVSGDGSAVYLAGGSGTGIDVRASCNATGLDTQAASGAQLAKSLPNGTGAVVVDATNLVILHDANIASGCPPTLSESRSAVALGLPAGYVARQVIVTPDSSKAIVSTDKGLVVVNLSTLVATNIALGGGAVGTFTGGVTLDSKLAYFGGDDGTVHRIDLSAATPTDVQQITVSLKKSDNSAALPNLVVVRNK